MADAYDSILWQEAEEWRHTHEMEAYQDDEPLQDLTGEPLDEDPDLELYKATGIF